MTAAQSRKPRPRVHPVAQRLDRVRAALARIYLELAHMRSRDAQRACDRVYEAERQLDIGSDHAHAIRRR